MLPTESRTPATSSSRIPLTIVLPGLAALSLLLTFSCAPPTEASNEPESGNAEAVAIEALIFEASEPVVDRSFEAISAAANGDTSGVLIGVDGARSLSERLAQLEQEGKISILAAPTLLTKMGVGASIQSGVQLPVQTVANDTVTTQFVNATLRLDITAEPGPEGRISLSINVQKRYPSESSRHDSVYWPIQTSEWQLETLVRDGGSAVLSGLYEIKPAEGRGSELVTIVTVKRAD